MLSGLQWEVERLEKELDELDKYDKNNEGLRKLKNIVRDEDESPKDLAAGKYSSHLRRSRPELLSALRPKLLEYGV